MPIKKWYWLSAIIAAGVIIILLLTGPSGNQVSNQYLIPAGTFGLSSDMKILSDDRQKVNASFNHNQSQQDQKLLDAIVSIDEWNIRSPDRYNRKITIIPVSDKNFNEYPELKRVMYDIKDDPQRNITGQSLSVAFFPANLSDYDTWLRDSICRNKSRIECYDDLPVFEYYGRYYIIGVAFF